VLVAFKLIVALPLLRYLLPFLRRLLLNYAQCYLLFHAGFGSLIFTLVVSPLPPPHQIILKTVSIMNVPKIARFIIALDTSHPRNLFSCAIPGVAVLLFFINKDLSQNEFKRIKLYNQSHLSLYTCMKLLFPLILCIIFLPIPIVLPTYHYPVFLIRTGFQPMFLTFIIPLP